MRKRRSKWGLRLLLLIVSLLAAAAVWYIRPERTLDMNYSKIAWKDKLAKMIETRKPQLELSEKEINDLAKQKLAQALETYELPVTITGMQLQLAGNLVTVHIHAEWGSMEIGAAVQYVMEYSAGRLVLNPEAVKFRMLSLSPAIFGLEQVEIDPAPYVPDPVAIEDILFHDRHITIKFTLDWLEIARYLSSY